MTHAENRRKWRALVEEFRASRAKSAAAWSREHGINRKQLSYWIHRLAKLEEEPVEELAASKVEGEGASEQPAEHSTEWLSLSLLEDRDEERDSGCVVRVGAATVEVRPGFDRDLLAEVVRTLVLSC